MSWRIAHVTATFPPYHGGTGNVCYHNARELARRGHQVHVFTAATAGAPAKELREGIAIHRLRPLARLGNAPVLPSLLWRLRGFDIIHLHYPFFGGEFSALTARLCHTPLVVTYHQDVFLSGALGAVERALRHTIGRATLRSAARLLFTSADYAEASYVRPLLRGREARVGALPNGVDIHAFAPGESPAKRRARHGMAAHEHVALLVASLDRAHYFKGVRYFLEALAELPQVKGVIVGDGDMLAEYQALAAQLGLTERITFAGHVAVAELPGYYQLADVTVLPSTTMGEAFGLVLIESLACGTPVIANNLPGVRTVVAHGKDGLLTPPADSGALAAAITDLLSDEPRRRAMGLAGRAKVEARYSWQAIGDRLEQIYQDAVSEQTSAASQYARGDQ